MDRVDSFPE